MSRKLTSGIAWRRFANAGAWFLISLAFALAIDVSVGHHVQGLGTLCYVIAIIAFFSPWTYIHEEEE